MFYPNKKKRKNEIKMKLDSVRYFAKGTKRILNGISEAGEGILR